MGNVYTVNEILVGALSDRPAPDRNLVLYVDSATGLASLCDGTRWNDFGGASYPGVTSTGGQGLTVPGPISAGTPSNTGTTINSFNGTINGTSYQGDYLNGQPPLSLQQNGQLTPGGGDAVPAIIFSSLDRNGRTQHQPAFQVNVVDATSGTHPVPANEPVFQSTSDRNKSVTDFADGSVVADGGIGAYGHVPSPTVPTATITTSTITDPAALTAIQDLINLMASTGFVSIATN